MPVLLDPTQTKNNLAGVIRRMIHGAIRSSLAELLEPTMAELRSRADRTDARFDQIDARFDQVDARFDQVDARFGQVDARFDQVDARFDRVDARFDQIDARFERVDSRFDQMDARLDRIDTRLDRLEDRFAEVDVKFAEVDARFSRLDAKMDAGFQALTMRLDEFGNQQGQLIRDVEALKRDAQATADIHHRIGRLEDRLLGTQA